MLYMSPICLPRCRCQWTWRRGRRYSMCVVCTACPGHTCSKMCACGSHSGMRQNGMDNRTASQSCVLIERLIIQRHVQRVFQLLDFILGPRAPTFFFVVPTIILATMVCHPSLFFSHVKSITAEARQSESAAEVSRGMSKGGIIHSLITRARDCN